MHAHDLVFLHDVIDLDSRRTRRTDNHRLELLWNTIVDKVIANIECHHVKAAFGFCYAFKSAELVRQFFFDV